jgi:CheY-like chemotaxis protein
MLPRLFEFFVQGETPGRGTSGLGIGLALARQLVELQGGTIEAHSDGPGRGSTFTIHIAVLPGDCESPTADTGAAAAPRVAGRRVLVIDDNVDAADMLADLITALDGTVATAYSGSDGLRRAAEFRPDVVLLDIGMPDMDGYETCRRLRTGTAGDDVYIVAVSGWGQRHDRDRALAEGFDAHLTKPADPKVLEELVARAPLRRRASGAD